MNTKNNSLTEREEKLMKEFMKKIFNYQSLGYRLQAESFIQYFIGVEGLNTVDDVIEKVKKNFKKDITPVKDKTLIEIIRFINSSGNASDKLGIDSFKKNNLLGKTHSSKKEKYVFLSTIFKIFNIIAYAKFAIFIIALIVLVISGVFTTFNNAKDNKQSISVPSIISSNEASQPNSVIAENKNKEVINYLSTNKQFVIDEKKYVLGWSAHPFPYYWKQEYFLPTEKPTEYSSMLLLEYTKNSDLKNTIKFLGEQVVDAKKKNTNIQYFLESIEKDKEYIFDFTIQEGDILEWNAYRYIADGNNIFLIGISKKSYLRSEHEEFLKQVNSNRKELINELKNIDIPNIVL